MHRQQVVILLEEVWDTGVAVAAASALAVEVSLWNIYSKDVGIVVNPIAVDLISLRFASRFAMRFLHHFHVLLR